MGSETSQLDSQDGEATTTTEAFNPSQMVINHLLPRDAVFRRLTRLRKKGWDNPLGDRHFEEHRARTSSTDRPNDLFFNMMMGIGHELQAETDMLKLKSESGEGLQVLDLCMAPGGFSSCAVKYSPTAAVYGITLPPTSGGYSLGSQSVKASVQYLDITMLADEFGVDEIPSTHPDPGHFPHDRPFLGQLFHLVFCDGQVLRSQTRATYRELWEAPRLTASQLVLALQMIRPGGTLVLQMHRAEAWHSIELLYRFSRFSTIQLFKPEKKHSIRSSFYLVAKEIQPDTDAAKEAVRVWKRTWFQSTFGGERCTGAAMVVPEEADVQKLLDEFGVDFIDLARPIWEAQAYALKRMKFTK